MPKSPAAIFARLNNPNPPAATSPSLDKAVVLGGSIAGLLAARVLSDHAKTVVLIDRDDPGDSAEARAGVPQGPQIHVLMPGGLAQLERWYPGFTEQSLAAGARLSRREQRSWYVNGVAMARGSQAIMVTGSRPFIEAQIRRRTMELPNVKALTGRVTGLEFGADAITGVRYESGGEPGLESAEFVVDAMGRSSRLSEWLEEAGWPRPPVQRMKIDLNYATALFRTGNSDPDVNPIVAMNTLGTESDNGGVMIQIEGARWMIMLGGYVENRPGRTPEDFIRVCRQEFPAVFGRVAGHEMIDDVRTYRHAESMRRDFYALARMPARLIAMGDAVSSFNPIYGQGMSSAALHASCLSEYLRSGPDLAKRASAFFTLQKVVVDAAWGISTGADLALPHVHGPYPRNYWITRRIGKLVSAAAMVDPAFKSRFDEVTFMLRHPSSLATPGMLLRAIMINLRLGRRKLKAEG